MSGIKIVFGLGNPGVQYAQTRHNAGFEVIDHFAEKQDLKWKKRGIFSEAVPGKSIPAPLLVKPLLYMNRSGQVVRELLLKHKIKPAEALIILDDFSLPLGKLRLRISGSAGGHNGLLSIIESLETQNIPRLRIGIGPLQKGLDPADFVLSELGEPEKPLFRSACETASEYLAHIINYGIEKTISQSSVISARELQDREKNDNH